MSYPSLPLESFVTRCLGGLFFRVILLGTRCVSYRLTASEYRGYSPTGLGGAAPAWNRKGYAFVSQQTRGNGGDDGSRFFPDEVD